MSSLTVEAHRKRFTVKATPMQPLSAVVADVLGQLKLLDVRPEDCTLSLRGKALDLSTPVRFAAAGRDKLELKTGREPVLGVHEAPHAAAAQPPTRAVGEAAAAQAQEGTGSTAAAVASGIPAQRSMAEQEAAPSAAPPPPAAATPPAEEPSPQQVAAAAPPAAGAGPHAAPAATSMGGDAPHPSHALFGMRVHVFTRAAEQQAEGEGVAGAAAAAAAAEDDSFFDFTEADLRRAMASAASQRAQLQGGPLMTAAMREREERRRAEAFGDVPIRLLLPDGQHCLQASLPATAPLSRVLELARAALPAELAPAAFLFTTPPRVVVKPDQLQRSLYAAKLVPAAKLHVGLGAAAAVAGGPLIRQEVAALAGAPPPRDAMHGGKPGAQQASQAAAQGPSSAAAADRPARVAAPGGGAGGAKAVPKWLKLSK